MAYSPSRQPLHSVENLGTGPHQVYCVAQAGHRHRACKTCTTITPACRFLSFRKLHRGQSAKVNGLMEHLLGGRISIRYFPSRLKCSIAAGPLAIGMRGGKTANFFQCVSSLQDLIGMAGRGASVTPAVSVRTAMAQMKPNGSRPTAVTSRGLFFGLAANVPVALERLEFQR